MTHTAPLLPILALIAIPAVWAQPPTHEFKWRSVLQPGATIGQHKFTTGESIGRVGLSDGGEFAFIAFTPADFTVFTSRRQVATKGDHVDGKILVWADNDARVAVNNSGQCAYEVWYADSQEVVDGGEASGLGIFVDHHLALTKTKENAADAFMLTDDGEVVLIPSEKESAKARPTDQIHFQPPRILGRGPIKIPALKKQPVPARTRPSLENPFHIEENKSGQAIMPVNLTPTGFMLLLGTREK